MPSAASSTYKVLALAGSRAPHVDLVVAALDGFDHLLDEAGIT